MSDEVNELLAIDGENKPDLAKKPGRGISAAEKRKRKIVLSRLLASGIPDEEIFEIMGADVNNDGSPGFKMSPHETSKAIDAVFASWGEEDATRNPHLKAAARRRIYRQIENAQASDSWTAVASLEKVLAQIEGTIEEGQSRAPAEIRIDNAVLFTLGEMEPAALREIIAEERLMAEKEPHALPSDRIDEELIAVKAVSEKDE